MNETEIIRRAALDPRVKQYFLLKVVTLCVVSIIGIPLLLIVFPIGYWAIQKYLDNLSVNLTTRTLEIKKGIFTRVESTIPLDKITDLQMIQGPIMNHFGIHSFNVETAGSTGPAGALVGITGIANAQEFRHAVLTQRDRIGKTDPAAEHAAKPGPDGPADALLTDIRDSLLRIEQRLHHRA